MAISEETINTGALDDRGTTEGEGRAIIIQLRNEAFDGSEEQLALALGRPLDEVAGWISGTEPLDDDVLMKARGIASERGVELEE